MKTLKKFLAVTLAVLMILSITPINALAAENCQHEWETITDEWHDVVIDGKHYCQNHLVSRCKKCGEMQETDYKKNHNVDKICYVSNDKDTVIKYATERYNYDKANDQLAGTLNAYILEAAKVQENHCLYYYQCTNCGYETTIFFDTSDKNKHDWVSKTNDDYLAPTCSKEGHEASTTKTCATCKISVTTPGKTIDKTYNHTPGKVRDNFGKLSLINITPNSCTEESKITLTDSKGNSYNDKDNSCIECGAQFGIGNRPALGHRLSTTDVVVDKKTGKITSKTEECQNKTNTYYLYIQNAIEQGNEENKSIENKDVYQNQHDFDFEVSFDNIKATKATFQFCSTNAKIDENQQIIVDKYIKGDYVGFQYYSADTGKAITLFELKVDNPKNIEFSTSENGDDGNYQATITITFKEPTSTLRYLLRNNKNFISTEYNDCISVEYENCNYKKVTETEHNYVETSRNESTCTQKGNVTYTCSRCGDTYTDELPLAEHTPTVINKVDATCSKEGYTGDTVCSVCNAVILKGSTIEKSAHDYDKQTVEPTCTEQGYTIYTCKNCNYSYKGDYTAVNENNHTLKYNVNKKAATCSEEGYTGDTVCTACGKTIEKGSAIKKVPHTYVTTVVEPNCFEQGYTLHKCSVCNDTYKSDFTQPDETKHVEVIDKGYPATCTTAGLTDGSHCSVCGNIIKEQNVINPLGHDIKKFPAVEATCISEGKTAGEKCMREGCDYEIKQTVIPKSDSHVWDEGVISTKATCSKEGKITYTCLICNKTKTLTIAKLEHSFGNNSPHCLVCGADNPNYVAPTVPSNPTTKPSQPTTKPIQPSVTPSSPNNNTVAPTQPTPAPTSTVTTTTASKVSKPKKTKIKKVKAAKKALAVTWKKVSGVKGYQVQVATDKKFKKNKKTVTIKKQKTTKTTIKKLKAKKKYYVRVRTYKTVNGKKVYSSWSSVKSVKTK